MALDVYVMPLWRFKSGDFRSPVEQHFGLRPKVIAVGGSPEQKRGFWGWLLGRHPEPAEPAVPPRQQVEAIRRAVEERNGVSITWHDEGEVVYSEQGQQFEALRAYAFWLDCRDHMPTFEPGVNGRYYDHPVWQLPPEVRSCPHLVKHDCHGGYHLPCDFEHLVDVEPYTLGGYLPAARSVGSSVRLLRELSRVQDELQVPDDYKWSADDPLWPVKEAYQQLKQVAELSVRHGLPVIYDG
ncbi:MAG: hypothetical protein ABGY75_01905 [Gemmataceae bacterium]